MDRLDEMKALAKRAWLAYDRCDIEAFEACMAPDWVEHDAGDVTGLSEARDLMDLQREAFPDKHTEFLLELAEGDLVAQLTLTTGTHVGRYFDLEPTGRVFSMYQINIHRVKNERISETWITVGKTGGPLTQLQREDLA